MTVLRTQRANNDGTATGSGCRYCGEMVYATYFKDTGTSRSVLGISLCRIVCLTDMEAIIMVREDGKRNFALRESPDDESSVFSGNTPRQAALKAGRRLEPGSSEEAADRVELKLREKGTDKVHIYDLWAWGDGSRRQARLDARRDYGSERLEEGNRAPRRVSRPIGSFLRCDSDRSGVGRSERVCCRVSCGSPRGQVIREFSISNDPRGRPARL